MEKIFSIGEIVFTLKSENSKVTFHATLNVVRIANLLITLCKKTFVEIYKHSRFMYKHSRLENLAYRAATLNVTRIAF